MGEALKARGCRVDFLSVRLSYLSWLKNDPRWRFAKKRPLNRWNKVDDLQNEYICFNLIHSVTLKLSVLNKWMSPIVRRMGGAVPSPVKELLSSYTDIVIESGVALLLLPELRRHAPRARIIYHAADRLGTIGAHPAAAAVLRRHSAKLDLVHILAEAIRDDVPVGRPTIYLPHGIDKTVFDQATTSPYSRGKNAVSVGDMLFDSNAVETMARANPDWTFHLFGAGAILSENFSNVIAYGEKSFDVIAPFIRFADIGIAPYKMEKDADYLSQSSMKMVQYTYCRLPIIAPHFASCGRNHVIGYNPGSTASIEAAFDKAKCFDRASIDASSVLSWEEKIDLLFPSTVSKPVVEQALAG
jgi:2-beta-glucuronyltransferase